MYYQNYVVQKQRYMLLFSTLKEVSSVLEIREIIRLPLARFTFASAIRVHFQRKEWKFHIRMLLP